MRNKHSGPPRKGWKLQVPKNKAKQINYNIQSLECKLRKSAIRVSSWQIGVAHMRMIGQSNHGEIDETGLRSPCWILFGHWMPLSKEAWAISKITIEEELEF